MELAAEVFHCLPRELLARVEDQDELAELVAYYRIKQREHEQRMREAKRK